MVVIDEPQNIENSDNEPNLEGNPPPAIPYPTPQVEALPPTTLPVAEFSNFGISSNESFSSEIDGSSNQHKFIKNMLTFLFITLFLFFSANLVISIAIQLMLGQIRGDISFMYKELPLYFFLLLPISVLPVSLFYILMKVRNMSKKSWMSAVIFLPILLLAYFLCLFNLQQLMNKMATMAGGTSNSTIGINKIILGGGSYIIFAALALSACILVINYKKFINEDNKIHKKGIIFTFILGFLTIGITVIFVGNAWLGSYEKPFIGYSKAEKVLGKNPVYFSYLPAGIILDTAISFVSTNTLNILFSNPDNLVDTEKKIIVIEKDKDKYIESKPNSTWTTKDVLRKGIKYNISSKNTDSDSTMTVMNFEKNSLSLSLMTLDNTYITQEELFKVAESAY
ncbi:MAG: hypothetical protein WCP14_00305 [bacterium]